MKEDERTVVLKETFTVDYQRVADDIRSLKAKPSAAGPFIAGTIISGLMYLPDNVRHVIDQIKLQQMGRDNFEILCLMFASYHQLRDDFIDQIAEYAEQGVFPEGDGQPGWNEKEFQVAIGLLMLTLNPESPTVNNGQQEILDEGQ